MDLRAYYQKIRKIEAGITEPMVLIVSRETPDGGKPGARADVSRAVAARLVAEEKAELATAEETTAFRSEVEAAWKLSQQAQTLTESELKALRSVLRPQKK